MSAARLIVVSAALAAVAATSPAWSQRPVAEGAPSLPTDPRLWSNSPPLSLESLRGKGVVFYFFDEECPRCAAQWPGLQTLAKQYEGKPIVFIAVNSGSDPRVLNRYLAQQRVAWPVIHDFDRSFESAMGVPKLSLGGETFAVRYVAGDGSRGSGVDEDFPATAEAALKGAAWRVDPAAVPPKLRPAWRAVELGDFEAAAGPIRQAVETSDETLKAGGEKLLGAVNDEVTKAAQEAQASLAEGNEWLAYKRLLSLSERFAAYDERIELVERAAAKSKELAKSDAVKDQLAAGRLLDKAVATGARGATGAIARAKGILKRLVEDYPSTDAAAKGQQLLLTIER